MITGNENHSISLSDASEMTKRYRDSVTSGTIIAHLFNKASVIQLLQQADVVGVRVYYGINESGLKELILTGVNSSGNDVYEGILLDRSIKCPQDCAAANPLNSDVNT